MSADGVLAAQRAAHAEREEWADYVEWRLHLFGAEFVVRDEGIKALSIHRRLERAGRHEAAQRFIALATREHLQNRATRKERAA